MEKTELEAKLVDLERRVEALEKQVTLYRNMALMLGVVVGGLLLMGATGEKVGEYDKLKVGQLETDLIDAGKIRTAYLNVEESASVGDLNVKIDPNEVWRGIKIFSSDMTRTLFSVVPSALSGGGIMTLSSKKGNPIAVIGASPIDGNGHALLYFDDETDEAYFAVGAGDNGGVVEVHNKTGENIAQIYADEYGNGVVGAYNRKGIGRTLQPGP